MGWDRGKYYTQTVREGGKRRRIYYGMGDLAELAASLAELVRQQRERDRAELEQARSAVGATEAPLEEMAAALDLLARAALISTGCYEHKRQWRRRGNMSTTAVMSKTDKDTVFLADEGAAAREVLAHSPKDMLAIVRRAEQGDEASMVKVRVMLGCRRLVQALGGDLAHRALERMVDAYAGKNPVMRAAVNEQLERMRADLAGPDPTALERLLVEGVVTTWFQLSNLELLNATTGSMSADLALFYQRAMCLAQKRHLAAITTLSRVRKLAVPVLRQSLQLNIGDQQVNQQINP